MRRDEEAYRLAYKYEAEYGGCAQSTLASIFDVLDVKAEDAFKSATGLAGGVGLSAEGTCGALIAGIMAISYFFGRSRGNFADPEMKRFETYRMARQYLEEFKKEFGSTRCADIQQKLMGRVFDLLDPEEWEEFLKAGGHTDKCPSVTGKAAQLAVSFILDQMRKK